MSTEVSNLSIEVIEKLSIAESFESLNRALKE